MNTDELHRLWDEKNKKKSSSTVRRGSPEHDLQTNCVRWFRYQYPFPKGMIFSIPNGGYRGSKEEYVTGRLNREQLTRMRLEEEGLLKGVPDLLIPVPRGEYGSLYIEMKNGKAGRLSEHQKDRISELQVLGNKVVVCRSIEEFIAEVTEYMSQGGISTPITHSRNV